MASKVTKVVAVVIGLPIVGVGAAYVWGTSARDGVLSQKHAVHDVDLVSPRPLTEAELDALRAEQAPAEAPDEAGEATAADASTEPPPDPLAGLDLEAIASERAIARGKHLVESRYPCIECHGTDLGGGTMIDAAPMGTWKGPNITTGQGSRTVDYTMKDWDHIVRHGIKPDGTAAVMPSEDFFEVSDEELTDIVAYIRSMPPVDATIPAPTFGPISTMLIATGKIKPSADVHPDHLAPHAPTPPETAATVEFGRHMSRICTGCHRPDFSGGPIVTGDPGWPDARNLTPGPEGLEGWTFENFKTALTEAKRPDGSDLLPPMSIMPKYAKNMTDTELQALWMYLQQLPPKPKGT